jgi:uncharacterized protein YhfF
VKVLSGLLSLVLCWSTAAAAGPPLSEAQRAFWQRCAARLNVPSDQPVRTRRFGDTAEMTQRLLPLVISGEKTITTTSPWIYERDPAVKPIEGGYSIVLDETGEARAVLRTTLVKTLRFDEVTEEYSQYEGKPVRPLEQWRAVHVRYFTRMLAPLGKEPASDMPVTLERFEVVCLD